MTAFGMLFGNVEVKLTEGEFKITVPSCTSCRHMGKRCPIKYLHPDGYEILFNGPAIKGDYVPCEYFIPKQSHVWFEGQWWR